MRKELCRADDEKIGRPFRVDDWATWTDGCGLLAIRNVVVEENPLAPVAQVRAWFAEPIPPDAATARFVALLAFAGDPTWQSPCPDCEGTGSCPCTHCENKGHIECECDECGDTHKRDCPECDGKVVSCEDCAGSGQTSELVGVLPPPVRVAGVDVDPRRLARLLACAPATDTVRVATLDHGTCLGIWAADWHVRLMALRGEAPARIFEATECGAAERRVP